MNFYAAGKRGWLDGAIRSAELMQQQGTPVLRDLAHTLIRECTKCQDLELCRRVQSLLFNNRLDSLGVLVNHLIRNFATCGSLVEANQAFSKVGNPSQYSWNAIISAHVKLKNDRHAVQLYDRMEQHPDKVTFLSILKASSTLEDLEQGKCIHAHIIKHGFTSDLMIGSTVVDMYAKCGSLDEAFNVFDRLCNRNVVTWAAVITGYVQQGQCLVARECYKHMEKEGIKPDEVIWGAMILGYAQHGEHQHALQCLARMQQEGIQPGKATLLSILKACGSIGAIDEGRNLHKQIVNCGWQSDIVLGNTLIDMYGKCGSLEEACKVFDALQERSVVTWSAMIAAYAQNGNPLLALKCFEDMQHNGVHANRVSFLNVLRVCSTMGAIDHGRHIHNQIVENGLEEDTAIGNTLIDMYAKGGSMKEAKSIFKSLPNKNTVTWNAMIAGYAQCGNTRLVKKYFEDMAEDGAKADDVTFATVLSGCSHAGLVNEGMGYFKLLMDDQVVLPDTRHYTCMVDLLGRTGRLVEAENLLLMFPADTTGWTSLLASCRTFGNLKMGRRCFQIILHMDSYNASAYMLMSSIYSDCDMWEDAKKLEENRQHLGVWKKPAKTWIEVNNQIHEFVIGDRSHPQNEEIWSLLKRLCNEMKEAGYTPKIDLVLQEVSDENKEDILCGHCERLAIAFGLLATPPGSTIHATKNLRVCVDCHNAMNVISKIEKREIIIRDCYHLHRFKDGLCSCGD